MNARTLVVAAIAVFLLLRPALAEQPAVKPIEKPAAKPIVIPFETLKSGHMAVEIKVNGKGPYRVIFDTGAPINLLNNKLAKEAELLKNAPKSMLPFVGSIAEVKVKELEVGTAKAADQHAVVMDHPLVELMSKKLGPLYGIVGFPFFARYRMTIDYQAETLTFVPNGYKPANILRSMESTLLQLMTAGDQPAKVLSPAAQWGLTARKDAEDDAAGVDVTRVLAGSAAAAAGLKPGDRLLTVDGRWTESLADLFEIAGDLKPGASVPIGIQRAGKEMELTIKLRTGL
ncbi:MAG TPA: PDZ domain-containing protein [Gemmataceae bacterium]|jgi:membrane-associated protease RseP (regulator of RpoE activity)